MTLIPKRFMKIKLLQLTILGSLYISLNSVAADVDFAKDVWPIFRDRCVDCHGPEKQKGKLRLDTREETIKSSVVPGNADDSEVLYRVTLPADDDDIMPPKGKPLSKQQQDIIKQWIVEGAKWAEVSLEAPDEEEAPPAVEEKGADLSAILSKLSPDELAALKAAFEQGGASALTQQAGGSKPAEPSLVEHEPSEAETAAAAKLSETGAIVMKVAQNVDWWRANFRLVGKDITDETIAPLADMPNLIELDLSRTAITDEGLKAISGLTNLTHLNLNNTEVSDAGLAHLAGLHNLTYLNVYGCKNVTDAGLAHVDSIRTLSKVYIWQSAVTDDGVAKFKTSLPGTEVVGGWKLPPVEEKKEDEKEAKEEPKKEQAKKPEAKKPATPKIAKFLLQLNQ